MASSARLSIGAEEIQENAAVAAQASGLKVDDCGGMNYNIFSSKVAALRGLVKWSLRLVYERLLYQ